MKCQFMVGIICASLCARAMDTPPASPFDLCSLRKYVMAGNDSLMRVVFPEEMFNAVDQAIPDTRHSLEMLFQSNPIIISYNNLYKIIFLHIRHHKIKNLQKKWLLNHKYIHNLIAQCAMTAVLQEIETGTNLGNIQDPKSALRTMMNEYVEYFFVPLQSLSEEDGTSPFDSKHYTSDERCPRWLKEPLNSAINNDREFIFLSLFAKLELIKNTMKNLLSGEYISKKVSSILKRAHYQHSLGDLADKILSNNNISQRDKEYLSLRENLCLIILEYLHLGHDNIKQVQNLYVRDSVYHAQHWKLQSIILLVKNKHKKKYYSIDRNLLIEIINISI